MNSEEQIGEQILEPALPRPLPAHPREGRVFARSFGPSGRADYYEFVPGQVDRRRPLVVSVHGISQNASEHAQLLARHAERRGVVVVAPQFDPERFQGFQRPAGRRGRAALFLERIIAEVCRRHWLVETRVVLFGFSGGAQFAHRYALLRPQGILALVVAAAGCYTFPDERVPYPLGLGLSPRYPQLNFWVDEFLRIPMLVAVGERDGERDPALNTEPEVDRLQGPNRIERSRRWVEALQRAAAARGIPAAVKHVLLPCSGHSFEESVRCGGLADVIFEAL